MSTESETSADRAVDDAEDSAGVTVMAPPDWKAEDMQGTAPPRRARVDPNVGLILGGKYKLERAVGHGGTGRVYVATQLSLERTVAVKILRPELESESSGEQFAERFFREASLAGSLSHPNVVTVHDYGRDDDGTCFIVMELVEGSSLKELMRAGPMDPERALDLFVQIARGLRHAHRAGLVHRDVKPGNVQITPGDDGRELAKLLDFGLVKSDLPEITEITREGSFLGTPHYASPEQVRGEEADARSDLYGLGIMLYRAFTGVLPYYSKSSMAMALSHVRDPYPAMAERAPDVRVDPAFEAIVRRLMEKEASRRYPDAGALLVDLEAALMRARRDLVLPEPMDAPVDALAPPSSPPVQAAPSSGRLPMVLGLVGLLSIGGGGAWWWGTRTASSPVTVAVVEPTAAPADAEAGDDWSAEVLEAAVPVSLQLALASEPSGATVWVAGEEVGKTPWVGSVAVDDGVHQTVQLQLDGYHPEPLNFAVSDGTASATVVLRPKAAAVPRPAAATMPPAEAQPKSPVPRTVPARSAAPAPEPAPAAPTASPSAAAVTVDGVSFSASQAQKTLQLANGGSVEAFHAAGIRTQEFNRVRAGRPYDSMEAVAAAPGVGAKTLQRMRDAP